MDELGIPSVERPRDPVADAFDEAFAEVFGKAPSDIPLVELTVAAAAASTAKNTLEAAEAAMDTLTILFGNKD